MPSTSQIAQMIQQVYTQAKKPIAGFAVKAHSDSVYLYENPQGHRVFAIRGMKKEPADIQAVSTILTNSLQSSPRFQRDLTFVSRNNGNIPNTLFVGHSLGGAICDQFLRQGIATKAITINPAVMPRDLRNTGNTRYYNPNDFLYLLIGRYASNVHLIGTKWDFVHAYASAQLPNLFSFWTAHKLEGFIKDYTPKLPFQKGDPTTLRGDLGSADTRAPSGRDYVVQSVVLHKSAFPNAEQASHWLVRHGYKNTGVDETQNEYRFRQIDPAVFKTGRYTPSSIKLGDDGYLIVGYAD